MTGFWKKTLIYLGLVEEDEELEPLPEVHDPPQLESVRPIRPEAEPGGVRPIAPSEERERTPPPPPPPPPPQEHHEPPGSASVSASVTGPSVRPQVRVHVVEPRSFNDAKEIGDKLKIDAPVIMNLQQCQPDLAKRLIDFASGLTYMASGTIQKVAERVFLLTPPNVEVSAEETQRIISERGFFNQY